MNVSMTARPEGGARVALRLTPVEAKAVECALRSELELECEKTWAGSRPGRDEIGRLRTILNIYMEQLQMLQWGDVRADVEIRMPTQLLESVLRDLRDGGAARIEHPFGLTTEDRAASRQRGRDMLATAQTVEHALAERGEVAQASR